MKQWLRVLQKEMLESKRNHKWIWLPLVFLFIGASEPITTYYLPQMLKAAGSLPPGATIHFPTPTAAAVMAQTLSQFNTMGLLFLALAFMNSISGERQSGVLSLILVKPVSHTAYLLAKWMSMLVVGLTSVLVGWGIAWYYTNLLFGSLPLTWLLGSMIVYWLWIAFALTLVVISGLWLRSPAAIALTSLVCIALLSVLTQAFHPYFQWSPTNLTGYATHILSTGGIGPGSQLGLWVTVLVVPALLWVGVIRFRHMVLD